MNDNGYGDDNSDNNENVTETKGLMRKTIVLHVRRAFWCISLPSSVKQQREKIKFNPFLPDSAMS